jgi:hypothetical protein
MPDAVAKVKVIRMTPLAIQLLKQAMNVVTTCHQCRWEMVVQLAV